MSRTTMKSLTSRRRRKSQRRRRRRRRPLQILLRIRREMVQHHLSLLSHHRRLHQLKPLPLWLPNQLLPLLLWRKLHPKSFPRPRLRCWQGQRSLYHWPQRLWHNLLDLIWLRIWIFRSPRSNRGRIMRPCLLHQRKNQVFLRESSVESKENQRRNRRKVRNIVGSQNSARDPKGLCINFSIPLRMKRRVLHLWNGITSSGWGTLVYFILLLNLSFAAHAWNGF